MPIYLPEDPNRQALAQFATGLGKGMSNKTLKSMFQDVLDAGGSPLTAMQKIMPYDADLAEKLSNTELKKRGQETLRKLVLQYHPEWADMAGESDDPDVLLQAGVELEKEDREKSELRRKWHETLTPETKTVTPKWDIVADPNSSTGYSYRNLNDPSGRLVPEAPAPRSGVTVNVGPTTPPSAQERTDIAAARTLKDQYKDLENMFNANYVGPATGRIAAVKDVFGMNPQKQSEFYALTKLLTNRTIKLITGAQMSEKEAKRIKGEIPLPTDPPSVWKAKLKQTQNNIDYMERRKLEVIRQSGLKVPVDGGTPVLPRGAVKQRGDINGKRVYEMEDGSLMIEQ